MTSSRSVSVLDGAICSSGTSSPVRGQPVLDEAVVGQLGQFLDADAGEAQDFARRPRPRTRGALRGSGRGACRRRGPRPRRLARGAGPVHGRRSVCPAAVNAVAGRGACAAASGRRARVRASSTAATRAGRTGSRSRVRWSIRDLRRRRSFGAWISPAADRAGRRPRPPAGRVVGGPLGDVEVERPDRDQACSWRCAAGLRLGDAAAGLLAAGCLDGDRCFHAAATAGRQPQRVDARDGGAPGRARTAGRARRPGSASVA